MKKHGTVHTLTGLAALGLLGAFAVCLLSVLLGGAGIYAKLVHRGADGDEQRTACRYLASRVRSTNTADLSVGTFGDSDALLLAETVDGESYLTRVYCHDGWLMELYSAEAGAFSPEDGERLVPVKALHLSLEDGFLQLELDFGTAVSRFDLSLRSGKEAAA